MKLPFDKIYCLHLSDNTNRYTHMINEFKRLGIESQVDFWWTCKRPISTKIGNYLTELHTDFLDNIYNTNNRVYGGVFNCAFEHYTIIKTSYERGFNSILIIEDDIKFINNINLIEWTFNNLPDNYCCVKFYGSVYIWMQQPYYIFDYNKQQDFSNKNFTNKCYSTALYCLDRTGMKKYIDAFDKQIRPADMIFEDFLSDIYYVKQPLCISQIFDSNIE